MQNTLEEIALASAQLNGGMISTFDPADIPINAVSEAYNMRCRYDKLSRRPGASVLTPAAPNTNRIMKVVNWKKNDSSKFFLRFSKSTIHKRSGVWTAVAGPALVGGDNDRFRVASIFDNLIFTNNGANLPMVFDATVANYAALGNAPQYRYVTGFYNRVVLANLAGGAPNPVQIAWSGDANITQFDPTVDISAGNTPLIESPGDVTDFITGVFGFTNVLVVLRERTIWLATKNPSATNPFNFFDAHSGGGCDSPYSACVVDDSKIAFVDTRRRSVFLFSPDGTERIGLNIERTLFSGNPNPDQIFGSYNSVANEYSVCIPQAGTNSVWMWTYNFNTKAWVRDERIKLSSVDDVDQAISDMSIDSLGGTTDGLVGSINGLVNTTAAVPTRFFGFDDGSGNIYQEVDEFDTDGGNSYSGIVTTKEFKDPVYNLYISSVLFEINVQTLQVAYVLYYSKDGGKTLVVCKTDILTQGQGRQIKFSKVIRAKRLLFKLLITSGLGDIVAYNVNVYPADKQRESGGV